MFHLIAMYKNNDLSRICNLKNKLTHSYLNFNPKRSLDRRMVKLKALWPFCRLMTNNN